MVVGFYKSDFIIINLVDSKESPSFKRYCKMDILRIPKVDPFKVNDHPVYVYTPPTRLLPNSSSLPPTQPPVLHVITILKAGT